MQAYIQFSLITLSLSTREYKYLLVPGGLGDNPGTNTLITAAIWNDSLKGAEFAPLFLIALRDLGNKRYKRMACYHSS